MKLYESYINKLSIWQELELAMENGEATEELLIKLESELKLYEASNDDKAINIARIIKGCIAESEALKSEKSKLDKRIKSNESTINYLTTYLQNFCEHGKKIEDATAKISWRKSQSVEIEDESKIPEEFKMIEYKISKSMIKECISSGLLVDGAKLVDKQNIQIK